MTSAAKTTESATQPTAAKNRREDDAARTEQGNGTSPAPPQARLEELALAQDDLTRQVREIAARRLLDDEPSGDGGARADRMIAGSRTELLQELLREQQEQARRQLADAARSGEDAVAGVVQSITTIVRGILPAALVRPEDLIEATYSLADQGLRVGRRMALTVTASARELLPIG